MLILILGSLASLVFAVHDVRYILSHPYWIDEAWVAVLSVLPIDELRHRAASAPLGWLYLMRLVPGDGEQRFRLLPLLFSAGTPVIAGLMAYGADWLHRWQARAAALTVGLAALLSPVALQRNDPKQFASDAFVTVLLLHGISRLDKKWTSARLGVLVALCALGALVSYVSLFIGTALFTSLLLSSVRARDGHLKGVLIAGSVTALCYVAVTILLLLPNMTTQLRDYWQAYYLSPELGPGEFVSTVWDRIDVAAERVGLGNGLAAIFLCALGTIALHRLGRPRTALAFSLIFPLLLLLGIAGRYPFLDTRTSHFFFIAAVVVAILGAVYAVVHLSRTGPALGLSATILVAVLATAWPHIRAQSIPNEDVRSQVEHVANSMSADDVVLVSLPSNFGVGYYWRHRGPRFVPNGVLSTGWMVEFEQSNVVVIPDRSKGAIAGALDRALETTAARNGRIWLIRSHVLPFEAEAWEAAISTRKVEVTHIPVGPEPLALLRSD